MSLEAKHSPTGCQDRRPLVPMSFSRYARPVRIPRRLERFNLGSMMSLVALVAERRVVKALGKKRR